MSKKYEIVKSEVKTIREEGVEWTLHRIRAVKTFSIEAQYGDYGRVVCEGELGGWVGGEGNLSQEGGAWIGGEAMVYGGGWVSGDAIVEDEAVVIDSEVEGCATVRGRAVVTGRSKVQDLAIVEDEAVVECAQIRDKGCVCGAAVVRKAAVAEEARVYGGLVEKTAIEGHTEVGMGGVVQGMEDRMTIDLPWLYTACEGMVWATCYRMAGNGLGWAYNGISTMTGAEVTEEIRLVHGEEAAKRFALVKGAVECCVRGTAS